MQLLASGQKEPLLIDVKGACGLLAISARTLWTLTDRGDIPAVRIGRAVRYSPDDLRAWIARSKVVATTSVAS